MLSHLDDVLGPAAAQAEAARDDFSRSLVLELFSQRDSLNPSTFAALQEAQAAANVLEAYNALELASDALHSDDVDLKRFAVSQLAQGMIEAVTSEVPAVTLQTAEAQQAVLSVSNSSKKAFALNLAMVALDKVSESPTSAPKALDLAASAVTKVFPEDGKVIAEKLMDVKIASNTRSRPSMRGWIRRWSQRPMSTGSIKNCKPSKKRKSPTVINY